MQSRKNRGLLLLLCLVMLAVVLWAVTTQAASGKLINQVSFRDGNGDFLRPHYNEKENRYDLYLPSYISPEDLRLSHPVGMTVSLQSGDERYETLAQLPQRQDILVTMKSLFRQQTARLQIWQCENLPTIRIQAEDGTMEFLHSNILNEKTVYVEVLDETGAAVLQESAKMSGRGNGTWTNFKCPYNLNFSNAVTVGPFENIKKLSLLAEFYDRDKLRNSLAYFTGQQLGIPYASGYQYADLFVNGEYLGLYGIVTKQEYTKYIQQDQIQAVFEYTSYPKDNQFYSFPTLQPIRVLYGDMEWVKECVDSFTVALMEQNWELCESKIDMASFAKKYMMDEFFANDDIGFSSQYFYLDQEDVIHCMLPWDYDLSMGCTNALYDIAPAYDITADRYPNYWSTQLRQYPRFRELVAQSAEECLTQELFDAMAAHLEQTVEAIAASKECDYTRWKYAIDQYRWEPVPDTQRMLGVKDQFIRYFPERRDFLMNYFRHPETYRLVTFEGFHAPRFFIPEGEVPYAYLAESHVLDASYMDAGFLGWYTDDNLTPEQLGPLTGNAVFRAQYAPTQAEPAPEPPQEVPEPLLNQPGAKLILVGAVAAAMLLMICAELFRRRAEGKREEVAV